MTLSDESHLFLHVNKINQFAPSFCLEENKPVLFLQTVTGFESVNMGSLEVQSAGPGLCHMGNFSVLQRRGTGDHYLYFTLCSFVIEI